MSGNGQSGFDFAMGGASVLGTGLAIEGDLYQGQSNANIANYNAQIADQDSALVQAQGAEDARRSLVNSRKMVSAGVASYGASGVSGGSVHDVLRAGAAQGELDALTIKYNADVKSNAYANESALDRYRAQNYEKAGELNAVGAVLGGIGSVAKMAAGA